LLRLALCPCLDYYSEQKKLEAKELRREAQAKQTEFDVAAKKVAENGLVRTLGMLQLRMEIKYKGRDVAVGNKKSNKRVGILQMRIEIKYNSRDVAVANKNQIKE
jgi:hypothetical protein